MRAKVKLFQKAFLPASVIGGFLVLILGPIGLDIVSIPEAWLKIFSLLPGILIVPIVAAVPLGLRFKGGTGKSMVNIAPAFFIMGLIGALQLVAGFGTNVVFEKMGMETYPAFGWELLMGFSGGHGTAGLLGNVFKGMNLPYWENSTGRLCYNGNYWYSWWNNFRYDND